MSMSLDRAVRVQSQFKVRIADAVGTSRIMKSRKRRYAQSRSNPGF